MKRYVIISLGCPRNLVDSEVIAGSLEAGGFTQGKLEDGVDLVVINTCAFVSSAREESVEAIIAAGALKKEGKVKYLVVCGCLPQLYKTKLANEIPEADLTVGTSDFPRIAELVLRLKNRTDRSVISSDPDYLYDDSSPRHSLTPKHYAYVKISEGCSNYCSYCIISRLRGDLRSRSIESVIAEVNNLAKSGHVKEIEIIGQDTTMFGLDRYGKPRLSELLREIVKQDNSIKWIRLLYTHPAHYSDELIDVIAGEEKICRYLDLPIQHISDNILRLMNRGTTKRGISKLISKLRKRIPGLVLRTSVIVGYPKESDKDVKELLEFLKDIQFDRLGAFIYSMEEGTPASRSNGQLSESVKQDRYDKVMQLQRKISERSVKSRLGRVLDVLIDEKVPREDNKFIARTQGDAPEIDGLVYVTGRGVKIGDFCKVKIIDTLEYDLVGEKV